MEQKTITAHGKRKRAVARSTLTPGKGIVRINGIGLDVYKPNIHKMRISEPLILAGELANQVNIDVTIIGGGITGQADSARIAIAKALVEYSPRLKKVFLEYDRQLLVADVRLKEAAKPNHHGQARAKRQKSYR